MLTAAGHSDEQTRKPQLRSGATTGSGTAGGLVCRELQVLQSGVLTTGGTGSPSRRSESRSAGVASSCSAPAWHATVGDGTVAHAVAHVVGGLVTGSRALPMMSSAVVRCQ